MHMLWHIVHRILRPAVPALAVALCMVVAANASAPHISTPTDVASPESPKHHPAGTTINDIQFLTEQYPPFNYNEEGVLKGISVDILNTVLKEMKATVSSRQVRLMPWARAYKILQNTPNSCLFVMTRSPIREHMFQWVGPIMPTTIAVIARKSSRITINTPEDLNRYTIAALQDDIGHSLLLKNGYPENKITKNPYAEGIVEMMLTNRVDAWAYEESVADYFIRKTGHDPQDFERIFVLEQSEVFFAFSAETSPAIVEAFRAAFDAVQGRGEVDTIIHRYIP